MSDLNVLFAVTQVKNNTVEETILNKYNELFNEKFTYSKEYYLLAIMKSLEENKFDILIIDENFENGVELEFIDKLTYKYSNLRIIMRIDDKKRGSIEIKRIFSRAFYDCIFNSDFTLQKVAELIKNPRNKKGAKDYYGIEDSDEVEIEYENNNLMKIPADELKEVLNSLNKANKENIKELFDIAINKYTFQQITYLISILRCNPNSKVISLLKECECDIEPYEKSLDKELNKNDNPKVKIKEVEKVVEKVVEVERVVEVEKEVIKKEYVDREVVKEVYKTPEDYKKIIAVIGADRKVGATTLIEIMANKFVEDKRTVSILDFSENQNLFERHIFNLEEEYREEPLNHLFNGMDKPYKISGKCLLYTSSPKEDGNSFDSKQMTRAIDITKINSDIILIDLKLKDLANIYHLLDKILVIISQDLISAKYFTNELYKLTNELYLSSLENKLQFVVNNYRADSKILTNKELVECYSYKINDYLNTKSNVQIINNKKYPLKVNYLNDITLEIYRGNTIINYDDEEFEKDIYELCNSVYPLSKKNQKKKRLLSKLFKNKSKKEDIE